LETKLAAKELENTDTEKLRRVQQKLEEQLQSKQRVIMQLEGKLDADNAELGYLRHRQIEIHHKDAHIAGLEEEARAKDLELLELRGKVSATDKVENNGGASALKKSTVVVKESITHLQPMQLESSSASVPSLAPNASSVSVLLDVSSTTQADQNGNGAAMSEKDKKVEALQNYVKGQQQMVKTLAVKLKQLEILYRQEKNRADGLKEQLHLSMESTQNANKELATKDKDCKTLNAKCLELKDLEAVYKVNEHKLQGHVVEAQQELKSSQGTVVNLTGKLEVLKKRMESSEAAHEERDLQIASLEQESRLKDEQMAELTIHLDKFKSERKIVPKQPKQFAQVNSIKKEDAWLSKDAQPDPERLVDPSKYYGALETVQDVREAASTLVSTQLAAKMEKDASSAKQLLLEQVL
jgi:predicted RNase H-like nuclease (RuvC/YqgF family)